MLYKVYRKRSEDMELSIKIGKIKVVLAILREKNLLKLLRLLERVGDKPPFYYHYNQFIDDCQNYGKI